MADRDHRPRRQSRRRRHLTVADRSARRVAWAVEMGGVRMFTTRCGVWSLLVWSLAWIVGCSEAPPPTGGRDATVSCDPSWPCPEGWVGGASGGCGPAVLLCAPDGGAAPGACDLDALGSPRAFPTEDSGTGWRFGLLPDGEITGGWSEHMPPCAEGWNRLDDGSCVPCCESARPGRRPFQAGGARPPRRATVRAGPFRRRRRR